MLVLGAWFLLIETQCWAPPGPRLIEGSLYKRVLALGALYSGCLW